MTSTPQSSLGIGTSGWSYDDWRGIVYPSSTRVDTLAHMARYFDALEVNVSFYRDVTRSMCESWLRRVMPFGGFRFTAKIHQRFTHQHQRRFPREELVRSLAGFEPLREAGRLAALLAQFPWSVRDEARHREQIRYLQEASRLCPLVIELRHDSWLSESAQEFLRSVGVGFCNIDQPALDHCIPPTQLVLSPVGYVRLHGRNHARWFDHDEASQRYDYLYTEAELEGWVQRIRHIMSTASETFVFANNHFCGQAPANALELKSKLAGRPVEVPEGLLERYPSLEKIASRREQERQGRLF